MLRVHVVEDDVNVASLVRHLLEAEGFMSVLSVDSMGAWDTLLAEPPDAAIIDLGLYGGESGWDLIERIRASERFSSLPIVILTGQAAQDVIPRATELKCQYLGKPFSAPALLDRLQLAIRGVGKAPTQRAVEAVLFLANYRVEGTVHVPSELERFSDAWEAIVADPRHFVPVTNARVFSFVAGEVAADVSFLQVRKGEVQVAMSRDSLPAS